MLDFFEKSRNDVIEKIAEYVENAENQTVELEKTPDFRVDTDEKIVLRQIYRKLSIENGVLRIEIDSSEGFEPSGFTTLIEDIEMLSANEIWEILLRIKEKQETGQV